MECKSISLSSIYSDETKEEMTFVFWEKVIKESKDLYEQINQFVKKLHCIVTCKNDPAISMNHFDSPEGLADKAHDATLFINAERRPKT